MALLELRNITAGYGDNMILKNFNFQVEKGELVSLLGPSGCGKTTTLRLVQGFLNSKEGQFIFDGEDYTKVPVHKRNFGYVFQNYALFPHLSIFDNVAFGLKLRKMDNSEINKRVMEMLEVVDLKGFEKRFPDELSGGQKQRVALARALVIRPGLLLFDEPLSNLDAKLRVKMRVEIRKIQQRLGITAIYVTHDQEECFSISDKVAVMNGGIIEQLDNPVNIYNNPLTEFTAKFVGFENFIDLKLINKEDGQGVYKAKDDTVFKTNYTKGLDVKGTIRPEDIIIERFNGENLENTLEGIVGISTFLGKQIQYIVSTKLGDFIVNTSFENNFKNGEKVNIKFNKDKLILV
ncbi:ABC transporter ATP-binding protein [Clostridium peptidivorans]|uniref:ABC transporter ATP-binding protein n=1 Tax=Clostridium peptidivorans TaxID=100174 RepID=UPI000BE3E35D|nr:ABC transporter ATP-binding protein [Clostridium peptidivorans]